MKSYIWVAILAQTISRTMSTTTDRHLQSKTVQSNDSINDRCASNAAWWLPGIALSCGEYLPFFACFPPTSSTNWKTKSNSRNLAARLSVYLSVHQPTVMSHWCRIIQVNDAHDKRSGDIFFLSFFFFWLLNIWLFFTHQPPRSCRLSINFSSMKWWMRAVIASGGAGLPYGACGRLFAH